MRVLSLDIGTKNLGLADLVVTEPAEAGGKPSVALTRAALYNIEGATIPDTIDNAIAQLPFKPEGAPFDLVLIEQQPLKHAKMLSLQQALYGAVRAMGMKAEVVRPQLRVKYMELEKGTSYSQRKKASVERVKQLFGESTLEGHGKKTDDVADAILQAVAFFELPQKPSRKRGPSAAAKPRKKKVKVEKPADAAEATEAGEFKEVKPKKPRVKKATKQEPAPAAEVVQQ